MKLAEGQAAQALLILSQVILVGLLSYLIVAAVKVLTLKIPLLVLNSSFLFFLLVGCALFTDWLIKNMDQYEGFCELGTPFMMPWLGLVLSLYGLFSISLNMYLIKFSDLE